MRGYLSALITLLLLSGAGALSVSISKSESLLSSKDNLTINYAITLNTPEVTNYVISLNDTTILNKTEELSNTSATLHYNVTSIPSGVYVLSIRVTNPSLNITETATGTLIIQKDIGLQASVPEAIYIGGNEATSTVILANTGNTELSISAYFKNAKSEVGINPQSLQLGMNQNRQLLITVQKPESDYNMTLVINALNEQDEIAREYTVSVIKPSVNVTVTNVQTQETGNDTIITMTIANNGNMNVNATLDIRTFTINEGFKTSNETIQLNANTLINYSTTINRKGVTGVTLSYNNGTSVNELTTELNPLNKIPIDIKMSNDRIILIAVLIAVVIGVIYFKRKKPERP